MQGLSVLSVACRGAMIRGACTPKRKPVTQATRSLAPGASTREAPRADIYFLLIFKDNRNGISIAIRYHGCLEF